MAIDEVRIHPAIGVARMGNSDSDFFIGPEHPHDRSLPAGGYKDAQCRIKRQAARFRLFGYEAGVLVKELTADDASIEWTVHLVNRKAAVEKFAGSGLRNGDITGADRDGLVIDPGERTLDGPDQHKEFDTGTFTVPGHPTATVPLGEVRTDHDGHLLVLGGFGRSGSPDNHTLGSFADSDHWYDDTSDGPVTAEVRVDGATITAAPAWVVVGPPKFAPMLENAIRLWDAIYDARVQAGHTTAPASPSYTRDIYPILKSATDIRHVVEVPGWAHSSFFTHPLPGSAGVHNRLVATDSTHMPRLKSASGELNQRLTDTQIDLMQKWSQGTVTNDWDPAWGQGPPPVTGDVTPGGADLAALENCVGGAFYPGIEAGIILTDASLYLPVTTEDGVPCFRLDHTKVDPGDLTAKMALPWQRDFSACSSDWWPVPRPNRVKVAGEPLPQDWARGSYTGEQWVTGAWNTMGFVTPQGGDMVETDRCDAADTWVSLVTPALTFVDVPQGPLGVTRKTARAIVFEVHSPNPVTLDVTDPTDTSLALYTATPHTVPATTGAQVATVRLWVTYAAPSDSHSVSDSVTATCAETGQTWVIPITANAVPRKVATAALALDKSWSMSEDRGDGLGSKSTSLRDAASTFAAVMLPGDSLSLTAFDDQASVVSPMTTLGDPNDPFDTSRSNVNTVIYGTGLDPGGSTSIGDGIETARGTLAGATAETRSLVVITDGMETAPKWISQVSDSINENTYSVGIGPAANISAVALETISGNHGGYLLVTGPALGGDNQFLLKKYFLQILAGISNAEVVLDPVGVLVPGQVTRVPFTVSDADNLVDVILTAEQHKGTGFLLETPDGRMVDPALVTSLGGAFVQTAQVAYYRVPLPLLIEPGRPSHIGTWHAVLGISARFGTHGLTHVESVVAAETFDDVDRPRRGLRYSVNVHAWSDVSMTASSHQERFTPGAEVTLVATVTESGIPVTSRSSVWAEVRHPSGSTRRVDLTPQGEEFTGSFTATAPGDHRIRVRTRGTTSRGNPFTRERTLTASVWRGGDTPPPGRDDPSGSQGGGHGGSPLEEHDRRWCEFLRCLVRTASANDRIAEAIKAAGLDPRQLLTCIERLCPDKDAREATGRPALQAALPPEVSRLIDELHRAAGAPGDPCGGAS